MKEKWITAVPTAELEKERKKTPMSKHKVAIFLK